jgi:hypothetical protein
MPSGDSFTWDVHDFEDVTTVKSLFNILWRRYGGQICLGTYSIRKGEWKPFDKPEQTEILRLRSMT